MMARLVQIGGFLITLALFAVVVGLGVVYILSEGDVRGYLRQQYFEFQLAEHGEQLSEPAGNDAQYREVIITPGSSTRQIAQQLFDQGLISDVDLFVLYTQAEGLTTSLDAGIFFLQQTQTIPDIAQRLTDASTASIRFRVLAGTRREEIAADIDQVPAFRFTGDEFLAITGPGAQIDPQLAQNLDLPAGATLEGLLYPDTYILPPAITALALRDLMLERFASRVLPAFATNESGYTVREIVSLAAIVEREAVFPDEYARIASVYRNRLTQNMTMDADPTVQYALQGTRGVWWPQLTLADYRSVQSPFNTYLNLGLPPNPIANPSGAAIQATLNAESTDFLFFRARCDGSNYHVFTRTYAEHLANACS